ncbi:MAG: sulfotransferase, partial [Firmicutes bacterium]|nr:sulfotransferase [Bacillota bacterium]
TIRDEAAYRSLFAQAKQGQLVGESSAFYLYYPGTARRIHAYNPDMKLLVVLRQPVSRAWSAYMHLVRDARETLPFAQSLELEPERKRRGFEPMWLYRELGLYSEQLERYFDVFARDQVKVILFDEFTRDTQGVMADVFSFLGVRNVPVDTGIHYNESGVPTSRAAYDFVSKPHPLKELVKPFIPPHVRERLGNQLKSKMLKKVNMDEATRAELRGYFAPEVSRLRALLERELTNW